MSNVSRHSFGFILYSSDPTWNEVKPELWSIVEVAVAILGACAITYRPLLKWISQNWISKIQPVSCGRTPRRGLIKSSNGNAEVEARPNNRPVFKHPLSVSLPSVPSSIHDPPSSRRGEAKLDDVALVSIPAPEDRYVSSMRSVGNG